jgi:hypothetical protein
LTFNLGLVSHVAIGVVSPSPFDFTQESRDQSQKLPNKPPGSVSGFGVGTRYWSYGVTLAGLGSHLKADWGVTFSELALQVKLGVELSLLGLSCVLTGAWQSAGNEIATSIGFSPDGVFLRLE